MVREELRSDQKGAKDMTISWSDLGFAELSKDSDENRFKARLIGVANISSMPPEGLVFLRNHIEDAIGSSEEYGQCQAGWWVDGGPPTEISHLLPGSRQRFDDSLANALNRLETATPGTASPGLLAFLRFSDGGSRYLGILKLDVSEQELYQFAAAARAEGAIRRQQLRDVLPTSRAGIRKVALVPNPSGAESNLRVVDHEASEGTATYWLQFLGARVIPPAPRVAKVVLQRTREVLAERANDEDVRRGMASAVADLAEHPRSARFVVRRAAEEAGVAAEDAWRAVRQRAGAGLPEQVTIAPRALERIVTEIHFRAGGQLVTVRGPAEALEGKYRWEPNAAGYTLTIATDDEPQARVVSKPGR
jgi:hypothetical protein